MDKKIKITLISLSVVMIVVAAGILLNRSVPPTSSVESINIDISDGTVDNLRFSNANLVGNQLTVLVQNTTSEQYDLKSITVNFIDQDNNILESADSYIGDYLNANEIKNLDVKTDADLSNLKSISYIINR